jgi:hypothetical protein
MHASNIRMPITGDCDTILVAIELGNVPIDVEIGGRRCPP